MPAKDFNSEIQRAIKYANEGKLSESSNLLEMLLSKDRKNTNILMMLAQLNSKTGDIKRAEQNYKKIIKLTPGNVLAHTNLGMLYHSKGGFPKAEKSYKQSLKLDPKQPTVSFNLGLTLQQQGKYDEAQQKYLLAITLNPAYTAAYANLAYVQRQLNQLDASIENYRKALEYAPEVPEIFYNLGLCLLQKGNYDEAEHCQQKALKLHPNYSDAWRSLGFVQLHKENLGSAIESFKQALVYDPENIDTLCGLAKSLSTIGQFDQAMDVLDKILSKEPDHHEARIIQGQNYITSGDFDDALVSCEYIIRQNPKDESVLLLMASIYEKKGQAEKAYMNLESLLKEPCSNADAVLCYASISKSINREDDAILMLEDVLANSDRLQSATRRQLHFALGKVYDSIHDYESAFKNYVSGNRLKQFDYDISSFKHIVDTNIGVFSKAFITEYSSQSSSARPVFIVGMPRSGTSLVEQILSVHPEVYGAGELNIINEITATAESVLGLDKPYPECLRQADLKEVAALAKPYNEYLDQHGSDVLHITDKMPTNFLHIGLIHTLFPDARIVHCMRNPLDTCLSCYFQDFGGNYPWLYDLESLAFVYKEYLRIMRYWRDELEIPIYEVQYENLVRNQEDISRELIQYIGLDWDESCMQFHENKRFIWTASYDQVRQPMYKKSIARWKNYEKKLSPLINNLGIIE